MKKILWAAVLILAASALGWAQNPERPKIRIVRVCIGTITKITDSGLVVDASSGPMTIVVTAKTAISRAGKPAKLGDFQIGEEVWAPGQEGQDGSWMASALYPAADKAHQAGSVGVDSPKSEHAMMPPPLHGTIQSIKDNTLVLLQKDGKSVTLALTVQTRYRKDGKPATLADFKVGDKVTVPARPDGDKGLVAFALMPEGETMRPGGGPRGGFQGGPPPMQGTLGKDYIAGDIVSVDLDALKIVVARPDGVKQTIVVDEQTSFRSREGSVTLADLKPGQHLMGRGALNKDGVFVPKQLRVMMGGPGQEHDHAQPRDGHTEPEPAI
jgi:hypothetical protein